MIWHGMGRFEDIGLSIMVVRFEEMDQKLHETKWIMKENHGMIEEHLENGRLMWI